ncbi:hypothetical protein IVB36_27550 [Bradyrhizobium sp. 35]|uniref:alpha/beta hydrolase family protein n=1 Tax=Bradyrhizobium sp. 35 TaxID=2782670 RepID=UPI001FFAD959|nr:hypothetical protein [Bradyrhizobium sp. 35]MCK1454523.1 hypothetical protein [Bradyrhizobium sp. 35]
MESRAWFAGTSDLASTRRGASSFLDSLSSHDCELAALQSWAKTWITIGQHNSSLVELNLQKQALDIAKEAWLCALTAFEVARSLLADGNRDDPEISARVESDFRKFGPALGYTVENLRISCDQVQVPACYLPAGGSNLRLPAVICISSDEEKRMSLLRRLLPVIIGRKMSILVVSYEDVAGNSRGESEMLLSRCLDYLSCCPDIDRNRIAVYGDGSSAALATDFAAYDDRVAAAVCDAGLWNRARTLGCIRWLTRATEDAEANSAHSPQLTHKINCPILVPVSARGIVSVSDVVELHANCMAAAVPLEVILPQMYRGGAEPENFVILDQRIFDWLEKKLNE